MIYLLVGAARSHVMKKNDAELKDFLEKNFKSKEDSDDYAYASVMSTIDTWMCTASNGDGLKIDDDHAVIAIESTKTMIFSELITSKSVHGTVAERQWPGTPCFLRKNDEEDDEEDDDYEQPARKKRGK